MLTIVTFIIVLGFLVFIHELGHFLAAKLVGVDVQEFSIGFPPRIASKTINGTKYCLSWIPLGGYVRLKGQNLDDEDPNEPDNYAAKSIPQRFFILVAGAMMNLVVALIFAPLVLYIGQDVPAFLSEPPVINKVEPGSHAAEVGVKGNDLIIEANGRPVKTWHEVRDVLASSDKEKTFYLRVLREGKPVLLEFEGSLLSSDGSFGWTIHLKPEIGYVVENSPAQQAGIQSGDIITQIDDVKINDWADITTIISESGGRELMLHFTRNGVQQSKALIPYRSNGDNRWIIGVSSATVRISQGFNDSVVKGVSWVWTLTRSTFSFLFKLFTGQASTKAIGGPIMIAQMIGQAAERGVTDLLQLVGFISLQLCIFNLLPIPALDGGHIFFLIVEKIKGGSLSIGFRLGVQKLGFIILMTLIILVLIQDGFRVFVNS
jgi:regulator of sigma E protease